MAGKSRHNQDELIVEALARGECQTAVATLAGCSVSTVRRRLEDPPFRQRIERFRETMLDSAAGRLGGIIDKAIKTLDSLMAEASSPAVRLAAARSVIEFTFRTREVLSWERRLSVGRIQELAREPLEFDVSPVSTRCDQAVVDWQEAAQRVLKETEAARERWMTANGPARLNRATLDFIRDGAGNGDRHRLLFSAAANLAEFRCPVGLAHELLTEAALDSGLSPSETRRQIDCGLKHQPAAKPTSLFTVEPPPSEGYYNVGL